MLLSKAVFPKLSSAGCRPYQHTPPQIISESANLTLRNGKLHVVILPIVGFCKACCILLLK
jgi:hypothetical protein